MLISYSRKKLYYTTLKRETCLVYTCINNFKHCCVIWIIAFEPVLKVFDNIFDTFHKIKFISTSNLTVTKLVSSLVVEPTHPN